MERINHLPTGKFKGNEIGQNLLNYKYILDFYQEYSKSRDELIDDIITIDRSSSYYTIRKNKPKFINRNNKLFVIVDKDTYSASEVFLFQLKTLGNVVIVGTNSSGCLLTGNLFRQPYYLPNSRISVMYGRSLIITNEMQEYDTRGFMTDLYIGIGDALML